ncbi:uncharacterized protein TNCV_4764981 [Trichonephila clavipes]|nr:uncharacterized protein TNCV_4764981 [Trichonephila clavipes]
MPCVTKGAYRLCEKKLLAAVPSTAKDAMNDAALEVRNLKKCSNTAVAECGVSVDGTRLKNSKSPVGHTCTCNHLGSASSMESVGWYRIFESSCTTRNLKYVHFYGEGDSQGYLAVKDMYGINSDTKYECIGHTQKRVGSRLRKLKKKNPEKPRKDMDASAKGAARALVNGFKSVTRVQRRVRTEGKVVTGLPKKTYHDSYKMNHAHDQQCLLSRKLKDTRQFEIPKFPSPLKFFPIGG